MPLYESVYIARPDISATQVEALTADMTKILEENGGKVTKDEYWGLKSLAYRIKKNIDAPAAALTEMERNMRLHEDVLRYMSIRVDEHEEEPSVMMQSKSSRDDRDRDRGRGRDDDRPKAAPAASGDSAPAANASGSAADDKDPFSGGPKAARSPERTPRRSITRTSSCCSALRRSAARSCRAGSPLCLPRSSASWRPPSNGRATLP